MFHSNSWGFFNLCLCLAHNLVSWASYFLWCWTSAWSDKTTEAKCPESSFWSNQSGSKKVNSTKELRWLFCRLHLGDGRPAERHFEQQQRGNQQWQWKNTLWPRLLFWMFDNATLEKDIQWYRMAYHYHPSTLLSRWQWHFPSHLLYHWPWIKNQTSIQPVSQYQS